MAEGGWTRGGRQGRVWGGGGYVPEWDLTDTRETTTEFRSTTTLFREQIWMGILVRSIMIYTDIPVLSRM